MKYSAGSIRHIRDDIWQARFTYYEDPDDHTTKKQTARNFRASSEREAQQEKARIHDQLEREAEFAAFFPSEVSSPTTLEDYLMDHIDRQEGNGSIEFSTAGNYRSLSKRLVRYLGDIPLKKITTAKVAKAEREMLENGLSRCVISDTHGHLRRELHRAVDEGIITVNPISRMRPPKVEKKDKNSLDAETRKRVMGIIDDMVESRLTLAIRMGLCEGLRNSEVCGLKWEDLDFESGVLKVRHAVVSSNGKVQEKITKTPASRRDIPLDPELARRLKRWASRIYDNEPQQLRGVYVLGTEDGHFYQPSTLRWQFNSFVETNEIIGTTGKPPTFYALRHTFATMLLQAGVDPKTVASLMGHTSVSMTLDVYACTDPKAKAAAGAVLSQVIAER